MTATAPRATPGRSTPATDQSVPDRPASILDGLRADELISSCERLRGWAEEEIDAARARYLPRADLIYHAYALLMPTHDRMARVESEFIYRLHCRELLERVASDGDTRLATAAEICCAMLEVCLDAPTHSAGDLAIRVWQAARHLDLDEVDDPRLREARLPRSDTEERERFIRFKYASPTRLLRDMPCSGRHHGAEVDCIYRPF